MLEAARHFEDYQMVIAAAPSVGEAYYKKFLGDSEAKMLKCKLTNFSPTLQLHL